MILIFIALMAIADVPEASQAKPADSVWFDADVGTVRPVEFADDRATSKNRDSRWIPSTKKQTTRTKTTAAPAAATSGGGLSIWSVLAWAALIVGVALLVALVVKLVHDHPGETKRISGAASSLITGPPDEQTIRRMSQLPEAVRRTDVNLRTETERLIAAGDFAAAIVTLFAHQLLLIDRAGWLRLSRGKTNRRYVVETASASELAAEILTGTAAAFDRSYFGDHKLRQDEMETLWSQNLALEKLIRPVPAVAA